MNSVPLSGCDKTTRLPCQNKPEEDGASASASLWGRDVSLNTIDMLQLAGRVLDSPLTVILIPSESPPAPPINDDAHNDLNNMQKLLAVLPQFGDHHPFYSIEHMADYTAKIHGEFAAEITTSISNGKKCNILVSLLLAYQFSFYLHPDNALLQAVTNMDAAFFRQYLRSVELYRQMSSQSPGTIQTEQVQELYDLVQETEFFPAAWLLVRLALNDENRYLFSPFLLPSLLAPFLRRPGELNMLVNVFSIKAEDAMSYFNKLEDLKAQVDSFEILPAHVFMANIAAILNGVPVTNNKWLEEQSGTPESVQMLTFAEWSDIINSCSTGGKGYIHRVNANCSYKEVSSAIAQAGKHFISKRQFESMRARIFKQHDKGAGDRRNRHIQILQYPQVKCSPFITGFIQLTMGLMHWRSSSVDRRPKTSLTHLVNAAKTGAFPLLHKTSGDIYFGFGRFEKAREQYQQLHSHDGLPESLKTRLESLIEICELNIPTVPEATDDTPACAQPQEKPSKARHRRRKKTNSATDSLPQTSASEAATALQTPSISEQPEKDCELPAEELTIRTSERDGTSHGRAAEQDKKDKEALADQVPAGFTTVSYARAKTTRETVAFKPKVGNFSDRNGLVQKFIREVNIHRNAADLAGEKKCIERWLQNDLVYGRICEDAAWFYLRQCILPMQMEPEVLECDLWTMKQGQAVSNEHMLNFALDWVARAMACYLESPLERRVRSDRLKEVLISLHEHYPDKKLDDEACKRLRSGCSGFGHIFSEWSALVRNSRMKELHMKKGREFFTLKRIADPLYYQANDQKEQKPEASFFGDRKVLAQNP